MISSSSKPLWFNIPNRNATIENSDQKKKSAPKLIETNFVVVPF